MTTKTAKERAQEIYNEHLSLAATDGRAFRKKVMEILIAETGCSVASAATHYNNCKKARPIEGLGRAPLPAGARKTSSRGGVKMEVPDNECFAVIELTGHGEDLQVGRYQSFLYQGEAGETFDSKVELWPNSIWVMIQGLGPNAGDNYRLEPGEKELRRYTPAKEETAS